jgi:hypothetical protein
MIKLKKLLFETPEADVNDTFEQYFLGDFRTDIPAKYENDTSEENKLGLSLQAHFGHHAYNGTFLSFIPMLIKYLKQGKYSKFLKTPNANAYRLLANLNVENANSILGIDLRKQNNFSGVVGNVEKYKSFNSKLASWTLETDPLVFENIVDPDATIINDRPNVFSVWIMIESKTENQEFIFNPDAIEKNTKDLSLFKESEVISYGDIEVSKASYIILDPENKARLTHCDYLQDNIVEFSSYEIITRLYKMLGV